MTYATEIDFSDARKVTRQEATPEAARRRATELVALLNTTEPMGADWTYVLYLLFLTYGKNFKLLCPYVSGLNPLFGPLLWAIAEVLSYQANRLRVKEEKLDKSL